MTDGSGGTVSVVVPTYYRNGRLREALESVRAQRYRPIEVVVVDGSGEAHARPVVEAFAEALGADGPIEDVAYVAQERDEGPQAARSVGVERASGRYVQFLDDDDRLRPTKLREQVPRIEPPVGVVYCGIADEELGEIRPDPEVSGHVLKRALEMNTFPCIPSTMLVDRAVIDDLLPLRHRHGADDTGMKIELAMRTRFDYVDEPLVDRGKPGGALSKSWAHIEGRKRLLRTYRELYRSFPPGVRATATRQTHYREGKKRLEEAVWSPSAVLSFARAAYHTPENRPYYVRECLASLFGRPGLRAADAVFS
ncbi:glycosyltransferase family 2 protein [Halegenticoccus soli]|uniref:glycosyltransferase family 2 protein n=1 Tax=Halegenticoccus soli TaxID=1985678 RepID=UPI000C6E5E45|nr:glycosyltransferase family 2 protein [Halegenticoccus soli]